MKLILIRKAETDEDLSRAEDVRRADAGAYRVYAGTDEAGRKTAEFLFDLPGPPERTPLLDDVPLPPLRDGDPRPAWLREAARKAGWYAGGRDSPEPRGETLRRIGLLIDRLEAEERDSVLICGGLTLRALKSLLRRSGYTVEGGGLLPRPLERFRAAKRSLHCGGCSHNCLLSEAKCDIGKSKARERGV